MKKTCLKDSQPRHKRGAITKAIDHSNLPELILMFVTETFLGLLFDILIQNYTFAYTKFSEDLNGRNAKT